jgi:hypothetical protein
MQLENAVFESELHVPRATFIVSVATTTTFLFFLKLRDISGAHAHQIYTPYADFLCPDVHDNYSCGNLEAKY